MSDDGEHLQHDAHDVVLRLRRGQAERVDLHAVAEAPELLVGDAVALAREAVPQLDERAQLAHLFDEADPRVHEERERCRPRAASLRRRAPRAAPCTVSSTQMAVVSA